MINNVIAPSVTVLSALRLMDEIKRKLLIILQDQKFVGVVSIGDIQRAILNQKEMSTPVSEITRKIITVCSPEDPIDEVRKKMIELRTECMPIIDSENNLIDVIYWENIVQSDCKIPSPKRLGLPVVIMAGGEGVRLRPMTYVIPKPLAPLGEKTFIEEIMDRFLYYGCEDFHISVNYKADLIEYYLSHQAKKKYQVKYIQENSPLGTAGSLHLLNGKIKGTFFVSNCDIIVDQDYSEILEYHRNNNNELTIVSAIKHYSIPYGTIETKENGLLASISEKPNLTFQINTGLYVLESHLIDEIPKGTFYHITYLIEELRKQGRNIGVFPVSGGSWQDIGEWKEYLKYLKG